MRDGFAEASEIPTKVLNVLDWAESSSVDPSQNMFELVLPTIPDEEVLKEEESRKFWNPLLKQVVESLD